MAIAIALFALLFVLVTWRFYLALDSVAHDGNLPHFMQMAGVLLGVLGFVPLLNVLGVFHPHAMFLAVWLGFSAVYSVMMLTALTQWTFIKVFALLLAGTSPLLALHVVHVI